MHPRGRNTRLGAALALALVSSLALAQTQPGADPVGIRGDISGSWYDPAQPGHGLMLEVLDGGRVALSWYTFDNSGEPMSLVGAGRVEGNTLKVPVATLSGGRFPPAFDPAATQSHPWGQLELEFGGCADGVLRWSPTAAGFGAGSMPVQRLTSIHGTRCNAQEEFGETREFSFERGTLGFEALFADRPPGEDAFYELDYQYEALPPPLAARRGVRLSGNNHSDDLAMLVKAPIRGLRTRSLYRIEVEMEMASDVPTGCSGIGGSPGDSVYLKLGASSQEPLASSAGQADGMMRLNIDFGQQSQPGENAKVVGTLANSYDCENGTQSPWELKTLSTRGESLRARTDADGTLWVFAGSDSAFEGRTDWYLTALRVRLDAIE
jgi:hypothetical protein